MRKEKQMSREMKRITHQFLQVVSINDDKLLTRVLLPGFLTVGVIYGAVQALRGDWAGALLPGVYVALLLILATNRSLQNRLLGQAFNRRHAVYIALLWGYALLWLAIVRLLDATPSTGKNSPFFYVLVLLFFALNFRILLMLFMLTPRGYRIFITEIPLWEQMLVVVNEILAAGMLAYIGGGYLAQILQPDVFTLRFDPLYAFGLLGIVALYYLGMQIMWVQRWNDWLSQNAVWVRLARLFAPLAMIVITLEIARRFDRLSDPRTVDLLGGQDFDLAVLALSPVIWLIMLLIVILVYTGQQGIRQRVLPDDLLEELPRGPKRWLSSISDMDMLLILGLLSLLIPAQLFLADDAQIGFLDTLRQQIFQQASALIDTSEQALALIFTIPFYLLIVALLSLYAYVMLRVSLSAEKRRALVARLPNGFLIIMIITLYLCAIPFTQVLTEGRLPKLPQDLGRILVFYVLIPLVLLYAHYYVLVRLPYLRGQSRWRARAEAVIRSQLVTAENSIAYLTEQIGDLEQNWKQLTLDGSARSTERRMEVLYRFVEINSQRDNLNMHKLRILSELQDLTDEELEIPLSIAKLPTRVVRYGIPLLLGINIYQWALVNGGLQEITNNPNLNVIEFFQIILQQTQF